VIRTLIAAASPVVRAGLEALLARSASVAIVATTSGETLADDIETHVPQVVLLAVE
jgi:DNA-binding NarL/FixJ family response regulator